MFRPNVVITRYSFLIKSRKKILYIKIKFLFVTTRTRPLKKKDGLSLKNILFPVFAQNVE